VEILKISWLVDIFPIVKRKGDYKGKKYDECLYNGRISNFYKKRYGKGYLKNQNFCIE
jgi:hypothetical protein